MAKSKAIMDTQPQRVQVTLTLGALNNTTRVRIPFSVTLHQPNSQAVEIIDVSYEIDPRDCLSELHTAGAEAELDLLLANNSNSQWDDWQCIGKDKIDGLKDAAPTAVSLITMPRSLKLPPKDMEGRGVILPPDSLWLQGSTASMTFITVFRVTVYYRVHDIDSGLALEMLQTINSLTT